jgi:hypothetical protein
MPVEMAIWRMTDHGPTPLAFSGLGVEERLEDMIVADPSLTGLDLLVVGRQVITDFGGRIDVLGVNAEGQLHVLELKRDRTPREVVAQALDYGSWVQGLTLEQASEIYADQHDGTLDDAFAERFDVPLPDVFNADQRLTIVASELDQASDRIVAYLAERFGVPINAVFFRYFKDESAEYLARTWLISPEAAEAKHPRSGSRGKVRAWNGRDFYVVLGRVEEGAGRWTIGSKYGFVGAGGGPWYWKPLRNLAPGKRVFAYVGGAGYVGVGEVTGAMTRLRDYETEVDGKRVHVIDELDPTSPLRERAFSDDDELTEYAVPVTWLVQRPIADAVSETGLFASQVTVCKLRDERTIEVVSKAFGLDD